MLNEILKKLSLEEINTIIENRDIIELLKEEVCTDVMTIANSLARCCITKEAAINELSNFIYHGDATIIINQLWISKKQDSYIDFISRMNMQDTEAALEIANSHKDTELGKFMKYIINTKYGMEVSKPVSKQDDEESYFEGT